jgi:hypothetical protein
MRTWQKLFGRTGVSLPPQESRPSAPRAGTYDTDRGTPSCRRQVVVVPQSLASRNPAVPKKNASTCSRLSRCLRDGSQRKTVRPPFERLTVEPEAEVACTTSRRKRSPTSRCTNPLAVGWPSLSVPASPHAGQRATSARSVSAAWQ